MFLTKQAKLFALSLIVVSLVPALTTCSQMPALTQAQRDQIVDQEIMNQNIADMKFDKNNPEFHMAQPLSVKKTIGMYSMLGSMIGFCCALPLSIPLYSSSSQSKTDAVKFLAGSTAVLGTIGAAWGLAEAFAERKKRKLYKQANGLNVHGAAASNNSDALNAHKEYNPASLYRQHQTNVQTSYSSCGNTETTTTTWTETKRTPLHYAVANKAEDTAEIIINSVPAKTLTFQDISKRSAVDYARYLGLRSIAQKIEQKVAQAN